MLFWFFTWHWNGTKFNLLAIALWSFVTWWSITFERGSIPARNFSWRKGIIFIFFFYLAKFVLRALVCSWSHREVSFDIIIVDVNLLETLITWLILFSPHRDGSVSYSDWSWSLHISQVTKLFTDKSLILHALDLEKLLLSLFLLLNSKFVLKFLAFSMVRRVSGWHERIRRRMWVNRHRVSRNRPIATLFFFFNLTKWIPVILRLINWSRPFSFWILFLVRHVPFDTIIDFAFLYYHRLGRNLRSLTTSWNTRFLCKLALCGKSFRDLLQSNLRRSIHFNAEK